MKKRILKIAKMVSLPLLGSLPFMSFIPSNNSIVKENTVSYLVNFDTNVQELAYPNGGAQSSNIGIVANSGLEAGEVMRLPVTLDDTDNSYTIKSVTGGAGQSTNTDNWVVNNKSTTSNYSYNQYKLVIPETISYNGKSYALKALDAYAFAYCNGVSHIMFPKTLRSISEYAFYHSKGIAFLYFAQNYNDILDTQNNEDKTKMISLHQYTFTGSIYVDESSPTQNALRIQTFFGATGPTSDDMPIPTKTDCHLSYLYKNEQKYWGNDNLDLSNFVYNGIGTEEQPSFEVNKKFTFKNEETEIARIILPDYANDFITIAQVGQTPYPLSTLDSVVITLCDQDGNPFSIQYMSEISEWWNNLISNEKIVVGLLVDETNPNKIGFTISCKNKQELISSIPASLPETCMINFSTSILSYFVVGFKVPPSNFWAIPVQYKHVGNEVDTKFKVYLETVPNNNLALNVGLGVGGGVIALAIVISIIVAVTKRKKNLI